MPLPPIHASCSTQIDPAIRPSDCLVLAPIVIAARIGRSLAWFWTTRWGTTARLWAAAWCWLTARIAAAIAATCEKHAGKSYSHEGGNESEFHKILLGSSSLQNFFAKRSWPRRTCNALLPSRSNVCCRNGCKPHIWPVIFCR